jgi:alginate O-acetyltransferase complex protein AlgI
MIQDVVFWLVLFGTTLLYWLLPFRWRNAALACLSFGFIAYCHALSASLMALMALGLYTLFPLLARRNQSARACLLAVWLVLIGTLLAFKWSSHYGVPWIDGSLLRYAVPLGMSYYTFRLLHLAMEAYKQGKYPDTFANYCAYVFLFPIFVAGPIERYENFVAHRKERFDPDFIRNGGMRIAIGLIKLAVIGHFLDRLRNRLTGVDPVIPLFSQFEALQVPQAWLFLVMFYVGAYLNLSAYSDIAIGASRFFGLKISENFQYPIFARNLTEFWRCWHMTLSSWCQTYVFSPMLGLSRNPYLALVVSFQVMGLWHVLTWNRVAWGLYQAGGLIVLEKT